MDYAGPCPELDGQGVLLWWNPQWRRCGRQYVVVCLHCMDMSTVPTRIDLFHHHDPFSHGAAHPRHSTHSLIPQHTIEIPQHVRNNAPSPWLALHPPLLGSAHSHIQHLVHSFLLKLPIHPESYILEPDSHHTCAAVPLASRPPLDLHSPNPLPTCSAPHVFQSYPPLLMPLHLLLPRPRMASLRHLPLRPQRNKHGHLQRRRLDARRHTIQHRKVPTCINITRCRKGTKHSGGSFLHQTPPQSRRPLPLSALPTHPHPHDRLGHWACALLAPRAPCCPVRAPDLVHALAYRYVRI